jgi:hypothetical protein
VVDNWESDKILNFLKETEGFPEAFRKIVWNHRKSGENIGKSTFLDFVDLFDMPGIGGENKHSAVIESVFKENKPDVILYLIDTDRGDPSGEESEMLRTLLQYITRYEPQPLFYWVYEKTSGSYSPINIESIEEDGDNILDKEFLKRKKQNLEDYITELANGNEKLGPSFTSEHISYLSKTSLLDARGNDSDTEIAQNAVSLVLQNYFCIYGKNYVKIISKILGRDNEMPGYGIMVFNSGPYSSNNPVIEHIISLIKSSDDLSVSNVKKIFQSAFGIEQENDLSGYPLDLKTTLEMWKDNINFLIDKMIESIRPRNIFGKAKKVSIDFINKKFWNKYNKSKQWQSLLFCVQAYLWLRASYSGYIASQYNEIGTAILNNIEKDIKKLEQIKVFLPIIENLEV